jgi:DNA mismatch repair protein MutS2
MPLADERTLEAIEFAQVRDRVVGQTRTERGRSYANALLPLEDFERVRVEQARTAAARELVAGADLHVGSAIETQALTLAASQGRVLSPQELRGIGDAIAAVAAAVRAVREDPVLREVVAGYASVDDLRRAIADAIDERDAVLDRASPALGRIRRNLRQAQDESRERVSSLLRSPKYANAIQDAVVTIREGRFVVPVKAEFAGEFPGIVHDSSSSGQTLFVEPLAALEANNRVRTLRIEEEREVERILAELSRRVGERAGAIEADVEILAEIDLLVGKARVAQSMRAAAPELDDAATLEIDAGRHPLLGDRAIPQSVRLDDDVRLIVISGPNMGGKTVTLKMLGLFVAMAYAGMQLPAAAGTRVGRFTTVVADIGDEQSIAANASTFSAHLDRMRDVLRVAGARALVLVDEIGTGTEPSAGAALAMAILEFLQERKARAVVTTHSTELKLWAHAAEAAVNASVRFDPKTFSPTYHLDVGAPGQSFSFALARARQIDERVVVRAEALLDVEQREYERALEELASRNAELQQARDALERERASVESQRGALQRLQADLRAEHERFAQRADERLQRALREFLAELARNAPEKRAGRPRLTPGQSAILSRTIDAMHRDLGLQPGASGEPEPQTIAFPLPGMRDRRESDRDARLSAAVSTRGELDVRGKRYAEAEPLVDRWLDDAMLAGNSPLRLIHGKGTGMLGRGLQAFLREHPAVASVRYGSEEEGSHGVTIIELKSS